MVWRMAVRFTSVCLHVGCICWHAFLYNTTRHCSSEYTKIFVESSLELVWDLLGIAGSCRIFESLLGVARSCWKLLGVDMFCGTSSSCWELLGLA